MKTNSDKTQPGLTSRAEQLNTRKATLARIDFHRRRVNRSLDTGTLLAVLRNQSPRFFELAEVVGRWVWIRFEQAPAVQTQRQLAQLGFHWNRARQAWQHPCGVYCHQSSWLDPRRFYGSYFAAD